MDDGEVLCAHAQGDLHKHPMSAGLPSVQTIPYPPFHGVGCGDMSGSLQDHRLLLCLIYDKYSHCHYFCITMCSSSVSNFYRVKNIIIT